MLHRALRVSRCRTGRVGLWAVVWVVIATGLLACGSFSPEAILLGRRAALRTPVGEFVREVATLEGPNDAAPALPSGVEYVAHPSQARNWGYDFEERPPDQFEAELKELAETFARHGVAEPNRERLTLIYQDYRAGVKQRDPGSHDGAEDTTRSFRAQADQARQGTPSAQSSVAAGPATRQTVPADLAAALPAEWVDYLQGADCFHVGDLSAAQRAWEHLLARPPEERLDRSVWAAFMLARTLENPSSPAESAARYQRVRELRAAGCRDRLNLAAASLGWEGRLALEAHDFSAAARLYYQQARAGTLDGDSLRDVAAAALGSGQNNPTILASARDPFLRRVVTLYLACSRDFSDPVEPPPATPTDGTAASAVIPGGAGDAATEPAGDSAHEVTGKDWLAALKTAGVDTVHEGTPIAWAAYQQGDYDQAAAWLKLAPADDPIAVWLRAKLALRDGKLDEAARNFARAVHAFPADPASDNDAATGLSWVHNGSRFRPRQFQMDLGIVQLSRGDCTQAFDSLLRSGFWRDAAYVAERVLTVDELSRYVHDHYPAAPAARALEPYEVDNANSGTEHEKAENLFERGISAEFSTDKLAFSLRYLLARRLARTGRYAEARRYYPAALQPKLDEYVAARALGDNGRASKPKRAAGYWRAAKIERALGMELFGTENEPDGFVDGGSFSQGDYRAERLRLPPSPPAPSGTASPPSPAFVPPVGAVEKGRLAKVQPQPFKRFHYRYLAADLAWKAAALMPDQQEETARVLAAGGRWLESVDATKAADRFYLAVLRRCNRTALGQAADKSGRLPEVSDEEL